MAEKVKKPREVATADRIQQYEGKLALLKTWESLRAETHSRERLHHRPKIPASAGPQLPPPP